jgi:hypothetical protein
VVEPDDVLGVDVAGRAGSHPFRHRGQAAAAVVSARPRPSFSGVGTLNGAAPGGSSRRT